MCQWFFGHKPITILKIRDIVGQFPVEVTGCWHDMAQYPSTFCTLLTKYGVG